MKEFKGTPGKWEITENQHYLELHPIGNIQSFASIHVNEYLGMNKDISKANAKLIAAAPELLEALQELVGHFTAFTPSEIESFDKAKQAINKAIS